MGSNHLIHFDLVVTDTGETVDFYTTLFDWSFGTATPEDYRSVDFGLDPTGGIMKGAKVFVRPYFLVNDIQLILDLINSPTGPGGSVIENIQPHPRGSYNFAVIEDNHGAQVGLLQFTGEVPATGTPDDE